MGLVKVVWGGYNWLMSEGGNMSEVPLPGEGREPGSSRWSFLKEQSGRIPIVDKVRRDDPPGGSSQGDGSAPEPTPPEHKPFEQQQNSGPSDEDGADFNWESAAVGGVGAHEALSAWRRLKDWAWDKVRSRGGSPQQGGPQQEEDNGGKGFFDRFRRGSEEGESKFERLDREFGETMQGLRVLSQEQELDPKQQKQESMLLKRKNELVSQLKKIEDQASMGPFKNVLFKDAGNGVGLLEEIRDEAVMAAGSGSPWMEPRITLDKSLDLVRSDFRRNDNYSAEWVEGIKRNYRITYLEDKADLLKQLSKSELSELESLKREKELLGWGSNKRESITWMHRLAELQMQWEAQNRPQVPLRAPNLQPTTPDAANAGRMRPPDINNGPDDDEDDDPRTLTMGRRGGQNGGEYQSFYEAKARKMRASFEKYERSGKRVYQQIPDSEDDFYLGLDTEKKRLTYEARMYLANARAKVQNGRVEFFGSGDNEVQKMTTEMWQLIFDTPGVSEGIALYAALIARPDLKVKGVQINEYFGMEEAELFKVKKEDHYNAVRGKFANYLLERGLVANEAEARVAEAMSFNAIRAIRLTEEVKSIYDPAFGPIWRKWVVNKESAPSFFAVSNYVGECVMNPGSMMVTSVMEKKLSDRKPWPTSNFGIWFSERFDAICPGVGKKPVSGRDINNVDRFAVVQKTPLLRNGFATMPLTHEDSGEKYFLLQADPKQKGKYEGDLIDAARGILSGEVDDYRINVQGDFDNNSPLFAWDFFGAKAAASVFMAIEAGGLPDKLGVADIRKYFINAKSYGGTKVERSTRETLFVLISSKKMGEPLDLNSDTLKLYGLPGTNHVVREGFDVANRGFWTDGS